MDSRPRARRCTGVEVAPRDGSARRDRSCREAATTALVSECSAVWERWTTTARRMSPSTHVQYVVGFRREALAEQVQTLPVRVRRPARSSHRLTSQFRSTVLNDFVGSRS